MEEVEAAYKFCFVLVMVTHYCDHITSVSLYCLKDVCIFLRSNIENQILKAGFTSREIVIVENDDPGGVFEFSPLSRGPWVINVS